MLPSAAVREKPDGPMIVIIDISMQLTAFLAYSDTDFLMDQYMIERC